LSRLLYTCVAAWPCLPPEGKRFMRQLVQSLHRAQLQHGNRSKDIFTMPWSEGRSLVRCCGGGAVYAAGAKKGLATTMVTHATNQLSAANNDTAPGRGTPKPQMIVAPRRRAVATVEPISPTATLVNLTDASGYLSLTKCGVLDSPPGQGPRATPGVSRA